MDGCPMDIVIGAALGVALTDDGPFKLIVGPLTEVLGCLTPVVEYLTIFYPADLVVCAPTTLEPRVKRAVVLSILNTSFLLK